MHRSPYQLCPQAGRWTFPKRQAVAAGLQQELAATSRGIAAVPAHLARLVEAAASYLATTAAGQVAETVQAIKTIGEKAQGLQKEVEKEQEWKEEGVAAMVEEAYRMLDMVKANDVFLDQVTRGCEEAVEEMRVVRRGLKRSREVMEGMVEEAIMKEELEELEELPLPRLLEVQGPLVAAPMAARATLAKAKVDLVKFDVFSFDSDDSD